MTSASEPTQEQTQQPEEQAEEQPAAPSGRQRQQQRPPRGRRGAAATQEAEAPSVAPKPRLLDTYRTEIVPAMMGEFEFKSVMEVPGCKK